MDVISDPKDGGVEVTRKRIRISPVTLSRTFRAAAVSVGPKEDPFFGFPHVPQWPCLLPHTWDAHTHLFISCFTIPG